MDVLIIDDSAAMRKILERLLRQADVDLGEVMEAGDGSEALELLQDRQVGLILCDINMPNMDGLRFVSEVRARPGWKAVPIVMITTEGSHQKALDAMHRGASGYVRKPFTAEQIQQQLDGLV